MDAAASPAPTSCGPSSTSTRWSASSRPRRPRRPRRRSSRSSSRPGPSGVGLVLATQNPVDVDYKALSNAGTWMIGRLQTEQDKARLLDGLSAAAGGVDTKAVGGTIAGLDKREFVLRQAGKDAPVTFTSRWAMSYLRGPLTREQISRLMADRRVPTAPTATAAAPVSPADPSPTDAVAVPSAALPAGPAPAMTADAPAPATHGPPVRARRHADDADGGRRGPRAVARPSRPVGGAGGRRADRHAARGRHRRHGRAALRRHRRPTYATPRRSSACCTPSPTRPTSRRSSPSTTTSATCARRRPPASRTSSRPPG